MARAVLSSIDADYQTVKPQPPEDLHERMAQALLAMGDSIGPIPKDAFTHAYVVDNFNLSPAQASRRIKHWLNVGEIRKAGRKGYTNYYVFTDAPLAPKR